MSTPLPQPLPFGDDVPVVVLVSASWAGPSRPAPTVLRELGRRWGTVVLTLLVEDPSEEVLDALRVDVVPTWLRFVRGGEEQPATPEDRDVLAPTALEGLGLESAAVRLEGPWVLTHRLEGAQPKHVVDDVLGPRSGE